MPMTRLALCREESVRVAAVVYSMRPLGISYTVAMRIHRHTLRLIKLGRTMFGDPCARDDGQMRKARTGSVISVNMYAQTRAAPVAGKPTVQTAAKQKTKRSFWLRKGGKERRKASPEAYEAVGNAAAAAAAAAALSDEDDGKGVTGARTFVCGRSQFQRYTAQHTLSHARLLKPLKSCRWSLAAPGAQLSRSTAEVAAS